MKRIAIIDHVAHKLYVEYVEEEMLDIYGGDLQAYINDTYDFEGDYSWDWIVDTDIEIL